MMRHVKFIRSVVLAAISFIIFFSSPAYALHGETHKALNIYIANNKLNDFCLNTYLQDVLLFQEGVDEELIFDDIPKQVFRWIGLGGEREDDPWGKWYRKEHYLPGFGRFYRHFHNPLTDNGLWDIDIINKYGWFDSSIIWAFEPAGEQGFTGNYSWYDVETYFYNALTAENEFDRQAYFARMFRGLGQLMHLVQDLSVPEHVRDDGHVFYNYEFWLDKIGTRGNIYFAGGNIYLRNYRNLEETVQIPSDDIPFVFLDPELFETSMHQLSHIPVANLFDTNTYNGENPDDTINKSVGLSEYTNANFISPDTMSSFGTAPGTGDLPYPRVIFDNADSTSSICRFDAPDPSDGETSKYYSKIRHGEHVQYFLRAYLRNNFMDATCQYAPETCKEWWQDTIKDNRVYANYAQKLIPRAVGYSAQLMQYFFEDRIRISMTDDGFYAKTDADNPEAGFATIKLLAQNISTYEEMPEGTVDLIIKYKVSPCDPFVNQDWLSPACRTGNLPFHYICVSNTDIVSIPKAGDGQGAEMVFDLTENLPLWATDVYLTLSYKGRVVEKDAENNILYEHHAVRVGSKDISEPTPIHIINNLDKICLDTISPAGERVKDWYDAGPEAITRVDTREINKYGNDDGRGDEYDVYAHTVKDLYIRFSRMDNLLIVGMNQGEYHYHLEHIPPGELVNSLYLLTDITFGAETFWISMCNSVAVAASDPLKAEHDALWPHFTIEQLLNMGLTDEFSKRAVKNQNEPEGRYVPSYRLFRGHELWGGIRTYFPPYHPDIYRDPENPETHCPEDDLTVAATYGQGLDIRSISNDCRTAVIFENGTAMERMVEKGDRIDGLTVIDIGNRKVILEGEAGGESGMETRIILKSSESNKIMLYQP